MTTISNPNPASTVANAATTNPAAESANLTGNASQLRQANAVAATAAVNADAARSTDDTQAVVNFAAKARTGAIAPLAFSAKA